MAHNDHVKETNRIHEASRTAPQNAAALAVFVVTGATLSDLSFDGREALRRVLEQSEYGSVAQAVAALALFAHPDTVAQTRNRAIFPAVRFKPKQEQRRQFGRRGQRIVWLDDNAVPNAVFDWCQGLARRPRDLQLNHIYPRSSDPDCFSALPNLCRTPSFLAKLTDHDPIAAALLRRRSYDLYGWLPDGETLPEEPEGYKALIWAPPLPAVPNLEATLRKAIAGRQSDFIRITREIGWCFSDGAPDPTT